MPDQPRRNDPCPCGSGAKYKNCCQSKASWRDNRMITGAGVFLLLALGVLFVALALSRGDSERAACPPGQVWSAEHGHCH